MRILLLGDLVGRPGREAVSAFLRDRPDPSDLVVVNAENAAGGFGLTRRISEELQAAGVHVITSGNHIWQQKEVYEYLDQPGCPVLRPANYPSGNPGRGWTAFDRDGVRILVINLQGRLFMPMSLDCPFRVADSILRSNPADVVIVDIHAEATSEKQAMAHHLDGRVTVVAGTHTHVLTADARLLPGGTACITDLGMCGAAGGIIGMDPSEARLRFLTGRPLKLRVAVGPTMVNGMQVTLDGGLKVSGVSLVNEQP
jgi:2',3'-cyclic-nucleotide 2'-phosphodiesterase